MLKCRILLTSSSLPFASWTIMDQSEAGNFEVSGKGSSTHQVSSEGSRIVLVQHSYDTFSSDFGQTLLGQFYVVCDIYGHVAMGLMNSLKKCNLIYVYLRSIVFLWALFCHERKENEQVSKFIFANKKNAKEKYTKELKLKIQSDFNLKIPALVYNYCQR